MKELLESGGLLNISIETVRSLFYQNSRSFFLLVGAVCVLFLGITIIQDCVVLEKRAQAGEFAPTPRDQPDTRNLIPESLGVIEYLRTHQLLDYALTFPKENTESDIQEKINQVIVEGALPARLVASSSNLIVPSQIPPYSPTPPQTLSTFEACKDLIVVLVKMTILMLFILGSGFLLQAILQRISPQFACSSIGPTKTRVDFCLYWGVLLLTLSQLLSLRIPTSFIYLGTFVGIIALTMKWTHYPSEQPLWLNLFIGLFGVAVVLHVFALPLNDWDARVIWFHSGKIMFYYTGSERWLYFRDLTPWHPDYPKAIGSLSCVVSQYFGYWNDAVAKSALLTLLLPIIFTLRLLSLPAVVSILLFSIRHLRVLTNGYMDAILAVYAVALAATVVEMLFLTETQEMLKNSFFNPLWSILLAAVLINLKNEGLVFFSLLTLWILWSIVRNRSQRLLQTFSPSNLVVLSMALLPYAVWMLIKVHFQIHNDLTEGGTQGLVTRAMARLCDGTSVPTILDWFLIKDGGIFYILAYFFFSYQLPESNEKKKSLFCFTLAMAYLLLLFGIYLTTPHTLLWHLSSSVTRVDFIPHLLFTLSILYLVVERSPQLANFKLLKL